MTAMAKVRVEPGRIEFEAADGQTVMDAAHDAGLYWPTTCGGQGICTSCACTIDDGAENLDPMSRSELRTLSEEMGEATVQARALRLACQARVLGDVVITKRGVLPDHS
jgi:2Fe-2S ferredoxin